MIDRRKNPWAVVVGSMIGLIAGNGPIVLFTYTIFLPAIVRDFGWTQANVGVGILFAHATAALTVPFVGMFIDRWGIRRVCLPFIVLFALSVAAIGLTPASPGVFILIYSIAGVFSAAQTVMPYTKAVAACFDRRRGLALGIALAGVGIGQLLMPQYVRYLIENFGWREAYFGLGLAVFVLAFPSVAFLVGQAEERLVERRKEGVASSLPGTPVAEAVRSFRFWAIGAAGFLIAVAVNGAIPHVVPVLTSRGITMATAAWIAGASGIAAIAGRICSGFLLDRFFASYVAIGFFTLPLAGIVLLASGAGGMVPFLAVICLGLGLGAEIDTLGYMTSRYFGLRWFGEAYGYIFGLFALGSGFGPLIWDLTFDATRSYGFALWASVGAILVAGGLVAGLGAYVYPAPRTILEAEAAAAT